MNNNTVIKAVVAPILFLFASFTTIAQTPGAPQIKIGNHPAVYDANGQLLPWISWQDAIDREMQWYLHCPVTHGYPNFVWMTFMDGNYQPDARRTDFIPAMQNGMGIISYLKYYVYDRRRNKKVLEWAKYMGDYLVKESNTPDTGRYPGFTRSTGIAARFPQPADCGTQGDRPYEIEPDKGAIAGYALGLLYQETGEKKYLDQALHNARVLVANMRQGDSVSSPWPFRVDYRTGEGRGPVCGDMVYIQRLLDFLSTGLGYPEFNQPRWRLWKWILNDQIPNLSKGGALWDQFFEDHDEANDRTAWAPLNLARYLLDRKGVVDSAWQLHTHELIEFVNRNFTGINFGVPICGEQDHDKDPWGGILSTYGAVLAMYTAVTGSNEYKGLALQALNFATYSLNTDGCPCEKAGTSPCRGGWQEDAHTDKIHNFVDALEAVRAWGFDSKPPGRSL
jgi:hypothetical protein